MESRWKWTKLCFHRSFKAHRLRLEVDKPVLPQKFQSSTFLARPISRISGQWKKRKILRWSTLYKDVEEFCGTFDTCLQSELAIYNSGHRYCRTTARSTEGNLYILLVCDYATSVYLEGLKSIDIEYVAKELYNQLDISSRWDTRGNYERSKE